MRYRIKFILLINAIWFISMDLPRQFASAQIDSFTRRVALRGFHGSPLANVLLADEGRPCRRTGEFCNGPGSCCTGLCIGGICSASGSTWEGASARSSRFDEKQRAEMQPRTNTFLSQYPGLIRFEDVFDY
eukprot:GHVT01090826.1.p2 GENE.GHVT01090826.1~~GHVT01090826.1.p2  ORF type:complete len:131 (+),score=5.53 GHVT01090826.1:625-1017(+)